MSCMARALHKTPPAASQRAGKSAPQASSKVKHLQRAADGSAPLRKLSALQGAANARLSQQNATAPVLQAYGLTDEKSPPVWRISDSDKSAIRQDQSEGGNRLYATEDIIKDGDKKLLAASSAIGLKKSSATMKLKGTTIFSVCPYLRDQAVVDTDHDRTKKLKEVNSGTIEDDSGVSDEHILALWTDCGKAARTIMGVQDSGKSPRGKTALGHTKSAGNPENYSKELYPKAIKAFFGSKASTGFLKKGVHYTKFLGWTSFVKPKNAAHAKRMYAALGEDGRDAFDKHVGINRYVNPDIGDAYTMVTEKSMPGFSSSGRTWNFHWAGVIGKDGGDNLTLEGYAVSAGPAIKEAKETLSGKELATEIAKLKKWAAEYVDRDWLFQMYGKEAGETFHDDHLDSGTHGNRATTLHASK